MAHSPAFKILFIELFPNYADFVNSESCMMFVEDALSPDLILGAKTLEEAKQIASRQKKIDRLRELARKDELHLWVKIR